MTTTTLRQGVQLRGPFQALALVLVFGIGMTLGLVLPLDRSQAQVTTPPVAAAQPRPAAPPAPAGSARVAVPTAVDSVAAYRSAIRNFAAANAAHDYAMAARFRRDVQSLTTPSLVADVYARYQDLLGSISTASAQHELRLLHAFRAQLAEVCAAPGFLASFPGCQSTAR
jgi:hypothetical protein